MFTVTKIFYVGNMRTPTERAHGIQVAKMCEAFIEAGASLELIVPNRTNAITDSLREFYNLRVDVVVVRLFSFFNAAAGKLRFNLQALVFAVSSFWYLWKKKRRGEKGIVYVIDHDQFSFFLLPLSGFPVFLEAHASKNDHVFNRFFFKRVRGIVTVSPAVAESITRTFAMDDKKIVTLPNGIDFKAFEDLPTALESRKRFYIPEGKKVFMYVGKFYDWKGLEIFPKVATFFPEDLFYFVGGTDIELMTIIKESSLPSNIVCVGERPFKEIPAWLSFPDVLVVTGTKKNRYSYYETSPMKLFEYMAGGTPIVAANTPAVRSIVTSREVFFYEPDEPADLARVLRHVIDHPEEGRQKVVEALLRVKEFEWSNRANRALEFMQKQLP